MGGIQWLLIRTLGTIPGPVLFGYLVDQSCLLKGTSCNGEDSACNIYDNQTINRKFIIAASAIKVSTFVFFALGHVFYKPPPTEDVVHQTNGTTQNELGVQNNVFIHEENNVKQPAVS